ncbi:MAG: BON domain-containing protein [Deltaproteobacteria bacterium]|nr:BON domain-containing protein [Deltaproteobacteria bacterium]
MAIITISRGTASGGEMLAKGLAEKLGYRIVTLETLVKNASRMGPREDTLQDAIFKPPGLLERLGHKRRSYLAFIQLALCEEVKEGNVIYEGNAGHLLLPPETNILRVRMIAPLALRIRMLREKRDISYDDAVAYVHKVDEQRRMWTKFLYGVDILDPQLYDMILNLHTMEISSAVEMVSVAARRPEFVPDEKQRRCLNDYLLAGRVAAALATDPRTSELDVDVTAEEGALSLSGRLATEAQVEAVLEIAKGVDGVKSIDRDGLDHSEPLI